MIDIKFLRENPDVVKENIKKKFQDEKLPLVDEVIDLDEKNRAAQKEADDIRAEKNKISKEIGALMAQGKKDEAAKKKAMVSEKAARLEELDKICAEYSEKVKKDMMVIPNIIDPSVPIGKNDTENVEIKRYGDPVVPDYEIPYHTDIMERLHGIDMDAAGRVAGNGFYYLMGDIARLHSAVLSYARDFMINKGFTYCIPPYMIHKAVVEGVMSFAEMDAMMYKIEGEDLYLIGTSEHSMIGKFIDQTIPEEQLPTSKYFFCLGDHASTSHDFTLRSARSPEQHSSVRTGISIERKSSTVYDHSLSYHAFESSGLHTTIISCFSNWWIR